MAKQKMKYPNLPDDFRELIVKARIESNLAVRAVARDLGWQPAAMSQYERGDRNMSYETAVALRDYYELDYVLPEPERIATGVIKRNRKSAPVESEKFKILIDGEVIEVLTFRRLGPVTPATHI